MVSCSQRRGRYKPRVPPLLTLHKRVTGDFQLGENARIWIVPGFFIRPYTSTRSPFTTAPESINYPCVKGWITSVGPTRFLSFVFFVRHQDKCLLWIPGKKAAFPITSMWAEHKVDSGAATWEIWKQEFSFLIKKVEIINKAPEATRISRNSICLLLYAFPSVSFFLINRFLNINQISTSIHQAFQ